MYSPKIREDLIPRIYRAAKEAFCAPYLTLMKEEAPQRDHPLREVFNALRWFVRAGCPWRMMPNDLPPWAVVYQQTQRWIKAGCFEAMAHDLRAVLRLALERNEQPSAVILDSRTLQSIPESGGHAGFDGHKKPKARRFTRRSIPWAICWRCILLWPMDRTEPKPPSWRKRFSP